MYFSINTKTVRKIEFLHLVCTRTLCRCRGEVGFWVLWQHWISTIF